MINADRYVDYLMMDYRIKKFPVERDKDNKGFYTYWNPEYKIVVPDKKYDDIGFWIVMTLRHEVGHIIFHDMYCYEHERLVGLMDQIKKQRWIFKRIQVVWYWSKPLRWLKRALGFSSRLSYSKDEKYDQNLNGAFSRADNELFCDWFSIWGYKEIPEEQKRQMQEQVKEEVDRFEHRFEEMDTF